MSDFKTMSGDERKALIEKISACLMENDLGDVTISTATENVGVLMAGQFEKSTTLKVEKNLKADQSAKGKTITPETALNGIGVPLHDGAARFYKEAGLM